MQRVDGQLFFSPSDLNHFVDCEHLTALDLLAVDGKAVSKEKDPQAEIIRKKGFEHERAWLEHLRAQGKDVVEIATGSEPHWQHDAALTIDAMRAGVEVIYQGVFVDANWRGIADFLVRVDTPSGLGAWSYEAVDAKLARHPKPKFVLQLCWYSEQIEQIQGVRPACMHVVLGPLETESYAPSDLLAYYRAVRRRFARALIEQRPTDPSPVSHCGVCGYDTHFRQQREDVVKAGAESGVAISGLKKCSSSDDTRYSGEGFTNTSDNGECAATDVAVVAGTSWLFAREEMAGKFDYLFIDEAGQVSLADAVAMSPCARNVVLLGDPQQLPNVTQGVHPGGVGVSVLEHLLAGLSTVPPERGLFLEETWRMHPDVCGFISDLAYDGRLRSERRCAGQRIDSVGLSGTGLRYLPVEHTGNAQQSPEEAALIAEEVRRLLDTGIFTDRSGSRRRLTTVDILVVAPYNM